MKTRKLLFVSITMLLLFSTLAFAKEITIFDKNVSGSEGTWYNRGTTPGEDQEVEPGMATAQAWDLEGFFFDGSVLSMVAGYNFKDGESGNGMTFKSGDIFIDVDHDATYGTGNFGLGTNGNQIVDNVFGYDYAIDLDFASNQYYVYSIDEDTKVKTAYYKQNNESNPWALAYAMTDPTFQGTMNFIENYDTDFIGATHYALELMNFGDFLGMDDYFLTHFTMQCGNDNMMGENNPVPEPATMALLGIGLIGLAGVGRKQLGAHS